MKANPDREWELLKSEGITVHQERCAMVRNRNADCLRCAKVCTSGCISYEDGEVHVRPEKCVGCGTCATMCPTCCLETHNPTDAELLARCLETARDGCVTIACERTLKGLDQGYDAEHVTMVGCLGRVEESLVVNLASRGIDELRLAQGSCDSCPYDNGRKMAQEVVATANALLDIWERPAIAHLVEGVPVDVCGCGRNSDAAQLEISRPRGQRYEIDADAQRRRYEEDASYIKVMRDGTLPHFLPDRRSSLLDALYSLGRPSHKLLESRLWGHIELDADACKSCRMCAVFCPTGAIAKFDDEDGSFGIVHTPADCVACGSCEAICPAHAITLHRSVYMDEVVDMCSERCQMRERPFEPGNPHSILDSQRKYYKGTQIYER